MMRGKLLALFASAFFAFGLFPSHAQSAPSSTGLLELLRLISSRSDTVGIALIPAAAAVRVVPDLLRLPQGVALFLDECVPGLKGRGLRLGGTLSGVTVVYRTSGTTSFAGGKVGENLQLVSIRDDTGQIYANFLLQVKLKDLLDNARSFPPCP